MLWLNASETCGNRTCLFANTPLPLRSVSGEHNFGNALALNREWTPADWYILLPLHSFIFQTFLMCGLKAINKSLDYAEAIWPCVFASACVRACSLATLNNYLSHEARCQNPVAEGIIHQHPFKCFRKIRAARSVVMLKIASQLCLSGLRSVTGKTAQCEDRVPQGHGSI